MAKQEFPLAEPPLTVGRNEGNDVRIDHPTVWGRHARVEATAEGSVLTDLGSRNGTFVNGKKIARAIFRPNDWISPGSHGLIFKDSVAGRRGDTESVQPRPV